MHTASGACLNNAEINELAERVDGHLAGAIKFGPLGRWGLLMGLLLLLNDLDRSTCVK